MATTVKNEKNTLKADSGSILHPIKDEIGGSCIDEPTVDINNSFFTVAKSPRFDEAVLSTNDDHSKYTSYPAQP